jgi:hypothetical protein
MFFLKITGCIIPPAFNIIGGIVQRRMSFFARLTL